MATMNDPAMFNKAVDQNIERHMERLEEAKGVIPTVYPRPTLSPYCAEYCRTALNQKGTGTGLDSLAKLIEVGRFGRRGEEKAPGNPTVPVPQFNYAGPPTYKPSKPAPTFTCETNLLNIQHLEGKSGPRQIRAELEGKRSVPRSSGNVKFRPEKVSKSKSYQPLCSEMCGDLERSRRTITSQEDYEKRRSQVKVTNLTKDLNSLPMHTVSVKWKMSPSLPCYTMEGVHAVLSRYGTVVALGQLTPNSGVVVFENSDVAATVVGCGHVGFCNCPIICRWWHTIMYTQRFARENQRVPEVKPALSKEAFFLHEFRQLQDRVQACFRIRGQNLTYDHTTFVP